MHTGAHLFRSSVTESGVITSYSIRYTKLYEGQPVGGGVADAHDLVAGGAGGVDIAVGDDRLLQAVVVADDQGP